MAEEHKSVDFEAAASSAPPSQPGIPGSSQEDWQNWCHNLPERSVAVVRPTTRADLQRYLAEAKENGKTLRVTAQRHAQPPLIVPETPSPESDASLVLVDLLNYADLVANADLVASGDQVLSPNGKMLLDKSQNTVVANAGVREDELASFLKAYNRRLVTVTAGGFFSVGGMVNVDVHGATHKEGIFAETALEFTLLDGSGREVVINDQTPDFPDLDGKTWKPLSFARVSLGALGVVTSVKLRVSTSKLLATTSTFNVRSREDFDKQIQQLLGNFDRLEIFWNPYSSDFVALQWKDDGTEVNSGWTPQQEQVAEATPPQENGAEDLGWKEFFAEAGLSGLQEVDKLNELLALLIKNKLPGIGGKILAAIVDALLTSLAKYGASEIIAAGFKTVQQQMQAAAASNNDMWITQTPRAKFMAYFLPADNLWDAMQAVANQLKKSNEFLVVMPMEFRFVKGGDSALAGTYSPDNQTPLLANLDLVLFAVEDYYTQDLLDFCSLIEQQFVGFGGRAHYGKMYGFFDPVSKKPSEPFNANFVSSHFRNHAPKAFAAFNEYRKQQDPDGRFYTPYLQSLLEG